MARNQKRSRSPSPSTNTNETGGAPMDCMKDARKAEVFKLTVEITDQDVAANALAGVVSPVGPAGVAAMFAVSLKFTDADGDF